MTVNPEIAKTIRVQLSAVLFRLRMPAATLAEFGAGKRLEVDLAPGQAPIVRLMVGGNLVALAAVTERDDQLVARVIRVNPDPAENPSDQWNLVADPAE